MQFNTRLFCTVVLMLLACAASRAQNSVYQTLESAYRPYMDPADDFGWPMKVKALCNDPYKFWRGSKDLFFIWCKSNAREWFADPDKFVLCHGDVHLGNVGSYPAAGEFGSLGFGLVDFDDSARLPFQIDLLEAYISMKLAAQTQMIDLDSTQQQQLAGKLVEAYAAAMKQPGTPLQLLAKHKFVKKVLKNDETYDQEVQYYTQDGRFKTRIEKKGELIELLKPADDRANAMAKGVSEAILRDRDARAIFKFSSVEEVRKAVKSVALRTRVGSSGSQGLKKYFVLLQSPFRNMQGDIILYLKQEIPAAAERSGILARDRRPPGQRIAEHLRRFNDPPLFLNSWCDIEGESFWVTIAEPWSNELDPKVARSFEDLLEISEVFGTTLGSARRLDSDLSGAKLTIDTETLTADVLRLGDQFTRQVNQDFDEFRADPAVKLLLERATKSLASAK